MSKKDFSKVAASQVQRDQTAAKAQGDRFSTAMAAMGAAPPAQSKAVLPLERITDRARNIREVDVHEAVQRALAIAEHGLLQNLVVDRHGQLIAGAHRRWALGLLQEVSGNATYAKKKLQEYLPPPKTGPDGPPAAQQKAAARWLSEAADQLAAGWEKHGFKNGVEVKTLDFSATAEPARAVAAEIVENTARSAFNRTDVMNAWQRMRDVGFIDVKGRPATGEMAIWPAMELLFGAHRKTLKKLLDEAPEQKPGKKAALPLLESQVQEALARAFQVKVTVKPRPQGAGQLVLAYDSAASLQRILDAVSSGDSQAPDAPVA